MKNLQSFLQSYNKSLINQARGPYWKNIGPRSVFLRTSLRSVHTVKTSADILPVRPSRVVNKMYVLHTKVLKISKLSIINMASWIFNRPR